MQCNGNDNIYSLFSLSMSSVMYRYKDRPRIIQDSSKLTGIKLQDTMI
jgi:hypothetical protein